MATVQEYKVVKLSEIAKFKTGRLNSNAAVEGGEFPFFTCSRDTFRTNTWSFDCECVLLAGNNANAEYPVKYFKGKFDAYQRTYVITTKDPEILNIRYLYYCIELKLNLLKSLSTGSATRFLTKTTLDSLEFHLPNKETQDIIVDNISNYDNLIENNNRRIAILEDMAQSLYREWFVKFRYPDHKDSDGNQKFIDSPLGEIPAGWEIASAAEAININPRTKLNKDGEKPFVGMSGLSQGSMVIGDIIAKTGNSGAKFINSDTLFARITPCLQNGKTGYVQFLADEQSVGFGSTEFIVLRESELLSAEFIYLLSRSNNFREHAIQSMTGATGRQRVHNDCFSSYYLPVPSIKIMEQFTELVQPMFKSIFNLSKRNENLKKQRDMLLPKLISGQIELKD